MTPNRLQASMLISYGMLPRPLVEEAYLAHKRQGRGDLCSFLVENQRLAPELAASIRAQAAVPEDRASRRRLNRRDAAEALRQALAQDPAFSPHADLVFDTLELLGQGGMGAVYRVRDLRLGREAAFKVLNDASDTDALLRFQREAEITARLDHPGIPPVYEAGTTVEGQRYLLMKLIEGRTLEQEIAEYHSENRPEDTLRRLLEALIKVGETLNYAHARGVIHRDLKPANIMIGAFGEVYVMDWGLACIQGEDLTRLHSLAQISLDEARAVGLTEPGAILGTPGYMAPEQAMGGTISARTDVFALGAILCKLLTDRLPVDGQDNMTRLAELIRQRINGPRQRDPSADQELAALASRCLAFELQERPADARDFNAALRARLATSPRAGRAGLTLAALIAVPILALSAYALIPSRLPSPEPPAPMPAEPPAPRPAEPPAPSPLETATADLPAGLDALTRLESSARGLERQGYIDGAVRAWSEVLERLGPAPNERREAALFQRHRLELMSRGAVTESTDALKEIRRAGPSSELLKAYAALIPLKQPRDGRRGLQARIDAFKDLAPELSDAYLIDAAHAVRWEDSCERGLERLAEGEERCDLDPRFPLVRSQILRRIGRLEQALAACDAALELWPKLDCLRSEKALVLFLMEREEAALAIARELPAAPGSLPAYFGLRVLATMTGANDLSVSLFLKVRTDTPAIAALKARLCQQLGEPALACRLLLQYLNLPYGNISGRWIYFRTWERVAGEHPVEAGAALDAAPTGAIASERLPLLRAILAGRIPEDLVLDSPELEAHAFALRLLREPFTGDRRAAEAALSPGRDRHPAFEACLARIQGEELLGAEVDWAAVGEAVRAREGSEVLSLLTPLLHPRAPEAEIERAVALCEERGLFKTADRLLAYLDQRSGVEQWRLLLRRHRMLSKASRRFLRITQPLKRLLEQDRTAPGPPPLRAFLEASRLLASAERGPRGELLPGPLRDRSLAALRRALTFETSLKEPECLLAYLEAADPQSAPARVESALGAALEADPHDPRLYDLMGRVHWRNHRFHRALVAYRQAGRLEPRWAQPLEAQAELSFRLERPREALLAIQELRRLKARPRVRLLALEAYVLARANQGERAEEILRSLNFSSAKAPTAAVARALAEIQLGRPERGLGGLLDILKARQNALVRWWIFQLWQRLAPEYSSVIRSLAAGRSPSSGPLQSLLLAIAGRSALDDGLEDPSLEQACAEAGLSSIFLAAKATAAARRGDRRAAEEQLTDLTRRPDFPDALGRSLELSIEESLTRQK